MLLGTGSQECLRVFLSTWRSGITPEDRTAPVKFLSGLVTPTHSPRCAHFCAH